MTDPDVYGTKLDARFRGVAAATAIASGVSSALAIGFVLAALNWTFDSDIDGFLQSVASRLHYVRWFFLCGMGAALLLVPVALYMYGALAADRRDFAALCTVPVSVTC
jgi:hypothetical protein